MTGGAVGGLVPIRSLASVALAVVDVEGRVVDVSPGFAELVGRAAASLCGAPLFDLVDPDRRTAVAEAWAGGEPAEVVVAGRRDDGLPFIATWAIPGGGGDERPVVAHRWGPPIRAVGELATRASGAGEDDDDLPGEDGRDVVDAALSHDVRGALRGVSGFLSLLARNADAWPEEVQGYLATARRSAATSDAMVELLVEYVRLGQRTLLVDAVPLADVVQEAAARAWELIDRPPTLEVAEVPTVVGHRGHLERLFAELLTNAAKFGASSVGVSAAVDGPWVAVAVDDDGPGIDDELRTRAFDLFRMLQGKGRHPGVGGGLALVRRIAEVHGGRCTIESSSRGGARVVTRVLVA